VNLPQQPQQRQQQPQHQQQQLAPSHIFPALEQLSTQSEPHHDVVDSLATTSDTSE
jgi:hypothetical protein